MTRTKRPGPPGPMHPIPIAAAERIARMYGYDQVVIIARRVGEAPEPHGEHVTTYGVNRAHCDSAAAQGRALKRFMGWPEETGLPAELAPDAVAIAQQRRPKIGGQ